MSAVVSLQDRGLDLVLGGGLRRVRRTVTHDATVLLVRGAAGTGKTLVGFHAACALAEAYQGSIAYACIELLPTELEAQIQAWRSDLPGVRVRHPGSGPRGEVPASEIVVEASLFDVEEDPMTLGDRIERFVDRLRREGHPPGVLVIDSLIDGYGIGSSASREFVDAVCKLAARWGIGLVLLEECAPGSLSPWVFAVDTVIELGLASEDGPVSRSSSLARYLTVLKHRFGPSDAGPHRFTLTPGVPLRVYPRPGAWLEPWTSRLDAGVAEDLQRDRGERKIRVPTVSQEDAWVGQVVAVYGAMPKAVFEVGLGLRRQDEVRKRDTCLRVSFSQPLDARVVDRKTTVLGVAHPDLTGHRLVRAVLDEVQRLASVRRLVLSDLRVLRSLGNEDELRRAVGVLCLLARRMGIAVVLIESTPSSNAVSWVPGYPPVSFPAPGVGVAQCVDFADLAVEAFTEGGPFPKSRVTNLHSGRTDEVAHPVAPEG